MSLILETSVKIYILGFNKGLSLDTFICVCNEGFSFRLDYEGFYQYIVSLIIYLIYLKLSCIIKSNNKTNFLHTFLCHNTYIVLAYAESYCYLYFSWMFINLFINLFITHLVGLVNASRSSILEYLL